MKKELEDLQPKLEQATIDNTKMMEVKINFASSFSLNIDLEYVYKCILKNAGLICAL